MAQLGNPQTQVRLGHYFAFGLLKADQRDEIADDSFRCAGQQDDTDVLLEVAQLYELAIKNKVLAQPISVKASPFRELHIDDGKYLNKMIEEALV